MTMGFFPEDEDERLIESDLASSRHIFNSNNKLLAYL